MEIWKTLRVFHIPTPPATTANYFLTKRYTNIPRGTKDRSAQMEYATRTGIRHILSVAVYPISQEPPIQTSGKKTIPVSTLGAPVAEAINIAKKNGVRFLSIPFIGAKPDDDDVEVYDVLLQTAVDAAKNPGTLTAIYINTYGDSPVRRTQ